MIYFWLYLAIMLVVLMFNSKHPWEFKIQDMIGVAFLSGIFLLLLVAFAYMQADIMNHIIGL